MIVPNRSLRDLTTLGIGGVARFFTEVVNVDEMERAVAYATSNHLPFLVLGKGSNCLLGDYDGLIILNKIDFCRQTDHIWAVGAGFSFSLLGTRTAKAGYTGLEFASGIPGTVGGAIFMNAGANGQETADVVHSVDVIDASGFRTLPRAALDYGYRTSPFQKMKAAIVSATFTLQPALDARKRQTALLAARRTTQPLSEKSAGCMFRNPPGDSAGRLIEAAGLKGEKVGGAEVSVVHANFIVNRGDATVEDVRRLIDLIKRRVKNRMGVSLQEEVIDVSR